MPGTRVVVDTNILVSALGWKGNERKALDKILYNDFVLLISPDLIDELTSVITREKFNFIPQNEKLEFLMLIKMFCENVVPKTKISEILEDPEDNKVLECAVDGNGDLIISGDDHLLRLGRYKEIKIMNAKEFLSYPLLH